MQAGPPGVSGWTPDVRESVTAGTRNWLFVKVDTDAAGITGVGEGSGWPRVVEAAVRDLAPVVVGEDAFDTERLWQRMHVAVMGHGVSGVVGRVPSAPSTWRSGTSRERRSACRSGSCWAGGCGTACAPTPTPARPSRRGPPWRRGYTAVKTGGVRDPVEKAHAIRDTVGDAVDLLVDLHGPPWLTVPDAAAITKALAPLAPLFVEEPLAPEDLEGYRRLRRMVDVPLAAGERHGGLHGISALLLEGLVDVAQPDAGRAGGLTGLRKIAALAEARFATVAPHAGSLGPVAEFAALHLLAAIPNALILERMDPDWPGRARAVTAQPALEGGHLLVPDAPGLGVDIDEEFVAAHPSTRNVGLASGGWPAGTEGATLYSQPRHPRRPMLG
jgi:galactonate dehydratase